MRHSNDFASVVRGGTRSRGRGVIVHYRPHLRPADPAIVGLVVGKSVGNSVTRHRVSRRLRAQLAARVDRLPNGSATVVRALPECAAATSAELGKALDRAFSRLLA
jgi:ribonuclease P protein component